METTIDSVIIDINTSADNASAGLKNLINLIVLEEQETNDNNNSKIYKKIEKQTEDKHKSRFLYIIIKGDIMDKYNIRSDLLIEAIKMDSKGIVSDIKTKNNLTITKVEVIDEEIIKKKKGK